MAAAATAGGPRALVTGATGFIGRHVVRALAAHGYHVTALVRSPPGPLEGCDAFASGDVTRPETLGEPIAAAHIVVHLASLLRMPWAPAFRAVNVGGTAHVAAACAAAPEPPVLVVVSSLAAAGPAPAGRPRQEGDPDRPVSTYGRVKHDADAAALARAAEVPVTVLRPPMVFGPGDPSALALFRGAARGWHLVPGRRPARLSMVYVEDLAAAVVAAAQRGERASAEPSAPPGAGVYHVAGAETPTFAELGALVAEAVGRPAPRVVRVPRGVVRLAALAGEATARLRNRPTLLNLDKIREAFAGDWTCDASKARSHLGFAPGPLPERLARTAAAYREAGLLSSSHLEA